MACTGFEIDPSPVSRIPEHSEVWAEILPTYPRIAAAFFLGNFNMGHYMAHDIVEP